MDQYDRDQISRQNARNLADTASSARSTANAAWTNAGFGAVNTFQNARLIAEQQEQSQIMQDAANQQDVHNFAMWIEQTESGKAFFAWRKTLRLSSVASTTGTLYGSKRGHVTSDGHNQKPLKIRSPGTRSILGSSARPDCSSVLSSCSFCSVCRSKPCFRICGYVRFAGKRQSLIRELPEKP